MLMIEHCLTRNLANNPQVNGQYPGIAEYKSFSGPRPEHELNRGKHFIHCGGEYPSSVILPFI